MVFVGSLATVRERERERESYTLIIKSAVTDSCQILFNNLTHTINLAIKLIDKSNKIRDGNIEIVSCKLIDTS